MCSFSSDFHMFGDVRMLLSSFILGNTLMQKGFFLLDTLGEQEGFFSYKNLGRELVWAGAFVRFTFVMLDT